MKISQKLHKHLACIKKSKDTTDKIIEAKPYQDYSDASELIQVTWEALFDKLCKHEEDISTADLNHLTSAIQKLTSSQTQIASFLLKAQEYKLKEDTQKLKQLELQSKLDKKSSDNSPDQSKSLTPEIIAQIEAELDIF